MRPPQASQRASLRQTHIPIGTIPSNKATNGKAPLKGRTFTPASTSTKNKDASQEMVAVRLSFLVYSMAFMREAALTLLFHGEAGSTILKIGILATTRRGQPPRSGRYMPRPMVSALRPNMLSMIDERIREIIQ